MIKLNGKEIIVKRFSNNESNVKDFEELVISGQNIVELMYESDSDLISLMFVRKRLFELYAKCTLCIWYMPYGRMDRKLDGKLFSLKYICEFINSLKFLKIFVMDPHSDETLKYLENAKPIYPIKDWLPIIQDEIGFTENDCIVFPDEGAAKRYADLSLGNVCIMDKVRNKSNDYVEYSKLVKGDIDSTKKYIVIDDICSTGDTLFKTINVLESYGAKEVYVIVTHCEKNILGNGFFKHRNHIKAFYTTKSMMNEEHPRIKYLDVDITKYVN